MKYIRWEPIEKLSSFYHFESIFHEGNSLKIMLEDAQDMFYDQNYNGVHKIILEFTHCLYGYRITEELFVMKTLQHIHNAKENDKWAFFQVENSEYDFIRHSKMFFSSDEKKYHFIILTDVYVIEVLSTELPIVVKTESEDVSYRKEKKKYEEESS